MRNLPFAFVPRRLFFNIISISVLVKGLLLALVSSAELQGVFIVDDLRVLRGGVPVVSVSCSGDGTNTESSESDINIRLNEFPPRVYSVCFVVVFVNLTADKIQKNCPDGISQSC